MVHKFLTGLIMALAGLFALPSVYAQVDGTVPSQDTLYIIEEETEDGYEYIVLLGDIFADTTESF